MRKKKTTVETANEIGISEQHQRFADEYLIDLHATHAYQRAFKKQKQSYEAAAVAASELLKNPKIQAYLHERRTELANALGVTQERVVKQFANLAFYDVRKLLNDAGEVKDVRDLDEETAQAIVGIEVVENWEGKGESRQMTGYTKKVKLEGKRASLVSLCEHLGWDVPKKINHTININTIDYTKLSPDELARIASDPTTILSTLN